MVGEHADGVQLVVVQQVRLVDDDGGGASALVDLGGQGRGRLSCEQGRYLQPGPDHLGRVHPPRPQPHRQQHVRDLAVRTARATRTYEQPGPEITPDLPRPAVAPQSKHGPARRTHQLTGPQPAFYPDDVGVDHEHSVPPPRAHRVVVHEARSDCPPGSALMSTTSIADPRLHAHAESPPTARPPTSAHAEPATVQVLRREASPRGGRWSTQWAPKTPET